MERPASGLEEADRDRALMTLGRAAAERSRHRLRASRWRNLRACGTNRSGDLFYGAGQNVVFELFAEGDKTRLKLTHEGIETFPKTPAYARKNFEAGWTEIIGSSLKQFVEKTEKAKS